MGYAMPYTNLEVKRQVKEGYWLIWCCSPTIYLVNRGDYDAKADDHDGWKDCFEE
jgi:hypothetical protein